MNNITIRDIEKKDLSAMKTIVKESWALTGQLFHNEGSLEIALSMQLNLLLHSSTFGRVVLLDNEVVGFILGSIEGQVPKYRLIQEVDSTEYAVQLLATANQQDIANINEFWTKTFQTYGELFHRSLGNYDGYVAFFVVSEKARGLKLGKKLMGELLDYFKSHRSKNIYLYTDTSCNFGFYDYSGWTRRASQKMVYDLSVGQKELEAYLYDYPLENDCLLG